MSVTLLPGDCRALMAAMEPNSVDAIVCDPPYGLEFMGKEWDRLWHTDATRERTTGRQSTSPLSGKPRYGTDSRAMQAWHHAWAVEAFRVLKPGGHLLAFSGTRTSHRMVSAIEDAGFEIRDSLVWLYGSGFPKSLNVGDGRGTALKPAHEPICVARKPLSGTVAETVTTWGTGALNVDACRIGTDVIESGRAGRGPNGGGWGMQGQNVGGSALGRWPANVVLSHHPDCVPTGTKRVKGITGGTVGAMGKNGIYNKGKALDRPVVQYADADGRETVASWDCYDDCAVAALDAQSGERPSGGKRGGDRRVDACEGGYAGWTNSPNGFAHATHGDTGGASRYFLTVAPDPLPIDALAFPGRYVAKSSRRERNAGLHAVNNLIERTEGMPVVPTHRLGAGIGGGHDPDAPAMDQNHHPTVKPVALMRWLVRLVTPPGGTVLDPFLGSGSTGMAAILEGCAFIGCELSDEYLAIAERRIAHVQRHGERWLEAATAQPKANGSARAASVSSSNTRMCNVCGTRSKQSGPQGRWPNCEHDDWSWMPTLDNMPQTRPDAPHRPLPTLYDLPLFAPLSLVAD